MARFLDVFADVTKEGCKIPKEDYLPSGQYPIIDQGQNDIAGYWDDEAGLYSEVPSIIFGDHTRVIKYVDTPCFLGADGVKLLKPVLPNTNCKYLYYVLCSAKIPNTGYNRHFKWLKEIDIPIPAQEDQAQIVAVLDKVCDLISLRKQQLAKLDELVKARFVEMFWVSENWVDWPQVTIEEISTDMRTGPFGSMLHHDEFVDDGVFVLGIDNAVENKFSYNRMRYITEEKYAQLKRYTVKPRDVIITIMGTVGRSAVIPEDMPRAINTKHLACITLDRSRAHPYFLSCAFQIHPAIQLQLKEQTKGAIMDGLNLTIVKKLSFALPPIEEQNRFVKSYMQTEKSKLTIQQSLDKLEVLKKTLMQEYFG